MRRILVPALLIAAGSAFAFPPISLAGADGKEHSLPPKGTALILVLLSECPIAQKLSPEMQRAIAQARRGNAQVFVVFADMEMSPSQARRHVAAFGLEGTTLLDPERRVAKAMGVKVAPAAAVMRNGRFEYVGRIDDRFSAPGVQRAPRRFDLRDALTAVLAGKSPKLRRTEPVGCTF